jgi:hypothetical protein
MGVASAVTTTAMTTTAMTTTAMTTTAMTTTGARPWLGPAVEAATTTNPAKRRPCESAESAPESGPWQKA